MLFTNKTKLLVTLAISWGLALYMQSEPVLLVSEYGVFTLLGVVGAIFANATGAGGGVVFVPFFNQLGLAANTTVATSFAIQCCGMTAGAITWWHYYLRLEDTEPVMQSKREWQDIYKVLLLTIPFSCTGLWIAQLNAGGAMDDADKLHVSFGLFSILLALAILATVPLMRGSNFIQRLTLADATLLPVIAIVGGMVTAFLSIGVGELVAVYLIFRRFNVTFAIACAVILSAFSVWAGVLFHLFVSMLVYWDIVFFAGAGAIIGGMLAKYLVLYFSSTHLKIFFACWILLLGVTSLPI